MVLRKSARIGIASLNLILLDVVSAACVETTIADGASINCNGVLLGSVKYSGASNYYVNLDGTGEFLGSRSLPSIFDINGFSNSADVKVNGKFSYDFVQAITDGGSAGLSIGYNLNNTKKGKYVDFSTSEDSSLVMNVNSSSYQSQVKSGSIVGIQTDGGAETGLVNVKHDGLLELNSSIDNNDGAAYGYHLYVNETDIAFENNGTMHLNSTESRGGDLRLNALTNFNDGSRPNSVIYDNNGTIKVDSNGASVMHAISIELYGKTNQLAVNNTGVIEIDSPTGVRAIQVNSLNHENEINFSNKKGGRIAITGTVDAAVINAFNKTSLKVINDGYIQGNILGSSLYALNDSIINTGSLFGNISLQGGDDYFANINGDFSGFLYTGVGDDVVTVDGGSFSSEEVRLEDGDDIVNLYAADYSELKLLNAGTGTDTLNIYSAFSGASSYATSNAGSTVVKDFNNINIMGGGKFLFDGDTLNADEILISSGGELGLAPSQRTAEINADVFNAGLLNLDVLSRDVGQVLTINGNYHGENGVLEIDTEWSNSSAPNGVSESDKLIITGDVTGKTRVSVKNGILGDVTLKDTPQIAVPEVEVWGDVAENAFWGVANTSNAGEAQLVFDPEPNLTGSQFAWMLGTDSGEEILSPDVPGYVLVPNINMEMIRDSIVTYRDRKGGEYNSAYALLEKEKRGFWGRMWHKHSKGEGRHRLDWKSNQSGYQIGHELSYQQNGEKSVKSDAYVSYLTSSSNAYDDFSAESAEVIDNKFAGQAKTHNFNLGLTRTYINADDGYKDFVVQFSGLNNKYSGRRGGTAKNKGWGISASYEQGAKFDLSESWYWEPMYQVMVNYLSLDKFNDGYRDVDQGNQWDGMLRLGNRFYFKDSINQYQNNSAYVKLNYVRDFTSSAKATIGSSSIREDNAKSWVELGAGIQVYGSEKTYFYMDFDMQKNLGSVYKNSYRAQFGINHKW